MPQPGSPPPMTPAAATAASRRPNVSSARGDGGVELGLVAHVGDHADGVGATRGDRGVEVGPGRQRVAQRVDVGADVDRDDAPPVGGEAARARGADAPAGAGHQSTTGGQSAWQSAGQSWRQRATTSTRRATIVASSAHPPAPTRRPGRRARRWATTARTPPARDAGSRSRPSGAVSPASARSSAHQVGARASSIDVSVRPAWASPPGDRAPERERRRPSAPQHVARRARSASTLPPWPFTQITAAKWSAERASSTTTELERVVPIDSVPAKPGVLAGRAVGERRRDDDVGPTIAASALGDARRRCGCRCRAAGADRAARCCRAARAAIGPGPATSGQVSVPAVGDGIVAERVASAHSR